MGSEDDFMYKLCVIEQTDLPEVSRFVIEAFGADVIAMATDMNTVERAIVQPAVGLLNAYSGMVAFSEVLAGLKDRTRDRIDAPDVSPPIILGTTRSEKIAQAQKSSLVLALARGGGVGTDKQDIEVIASIELRLQVSWNRRFTVWTPGNRATCFNDN